MKRSNVAWLVLIFCLLGSASASAFDQSLADLQQRLVELGYDPGPVDGLPGSRTTNALRQLQEDSGIEVTGTPDQMLVALRGYSPREPEVFSRSGSDALVTITNGRATFSSFSQDTSLYVAVDGRAISLHQYPSGRKLRGFVGHTDVANGAAISPDNRTVVSTAGDGTIRWWDAMTGVESRVLSAATCVDTQGTKVQGKYYAPSFSNSGALLAATDYYCGHVVVWESETGKEMVNISTSRPPSDVKFSPDESLIAWRETSGSSGDADLIVHVAESSTGVVVRTIDVPYAQLDARTSPTFSPDGKLILVGGVVEGADESWKEGFLAFDVGTGKQALEAITPIDSPGPYGRSLWDWSYVLAVSPDSKNVALLGIIDLDYLSPGNTATTIKVWSLSSGTQLRAMVSPSVIDSLAFDPALPDILRLAGGAVTYDYAADRLERLDIRRARDAGEDLAFVDSTTLRAIGPAGSVFYNLTDGRPFGAKWADEVSDFEVVDVSPRGDTIATLDAFDLRLRPIDPGEGDGTQIGNKLSYGEGSFSGDGEFFAISEGFWAAAEVVVWEVDGAREVSRFEVGIGDGPTVTSAVSMSPDGSTIAVAEFGGTRGRLVSFWKQNGRAIKSVKTDQNILSISYSPDGTLVAGSGIGYVAVWDTSTYKLLWKKKTSHGDTKVSFTDDATQVISVSADGWVGIWGAQSGRAVQEFPVLNAISATALSDDGRILAVATSEVTALYDTENGKQLAKTVLFEDGEWVTLTPEGFFDASPKGAEQLNIVIGLNAHSIDQAYDALYRPDLVRAALVGDPDGLVASAADRLNLETVIESGAAPRVRIANLTEGAVVEDESVEVTANITDLGGGIGKIEWRVNGITLGVEGRGFDRLSVDAQVTAAEPVELSKTLSLDPGKNVIEVVAYNQLGLIASDPASITVSWDGVSAATPPRLFVLSVGVNDYFDSRLQLTFAASDARAIGAAFQAAGSSLYESVDVTTVLDGDVTAANLDRVFDELSSKVRPRDVFVLFMAGHGKTQDGRYYFLPADFRYTDEISIASSGIDQNQFQDWLARIPARKSVLLYDTCDSGSLTNGLASRGLEEVAALARMTRAMGRTVLSASTDDAPALEGYEGHGVFTYALLQAFGEGDSDGDGTIEVTELAGAVDKVVPEISYAAFNLRQIPQMSVVGSDFPLARSVAVLDAAAEVIPTRPTHFVAVETVLHATADGSSAGSASLPAGTAVRVVRTESEWSFVARDGRAVGYVPSANLLLIQ